MRVIVLLALASLVACTTALAQQPPPAPPAPPQPPKADVPLPPNPVPRNEGPPPSGDPVAYDMGYKQGIEEAERELKEDRATIYTGGLGSLFDFFDEQTGLPIKPIVGCEIEDEELGRLRGHNERMRAHIEKNGVPSYSFKRWEKEIKEPGRYWRSRERDEPPLAIDKDGPPLTSTEGVVVRPSRRKFRYDDGREGVGLYVTTVVNGVERGTSPVLLDKGNSQLIWGPKGSNFAVIRSDAGRGDWWYMVLDLRTGLRLREGT